MNGNSALSVGNTLPSIKPSSGKSHTFIYTPRYGTNNPAQDYTIDLCNYTTSISESDYRESENELQKWIENTTSISFNMDLSFYQNLKNGIILCTLMNQLFPNSIKMQDVKQNQTSLWHETNNIEIFLKACKQQLQLREESLFSFNDLKDEKQKALIIGCLYQIKKKSTNKL